ncbi:MAG: Gfo/Idh/MocA family oxidoreductase [Minisyncoccia bacterium]
MAQKKIYRGIVIGCGAIGALMEHEPDRPKPATHAGAFSTHKKVQLVALVDTDAKKLKAALKMYPHARGYADAATCIKTEKPDIVAIATDPSARLGIIRACLAHKVPMLICEKPLAHSTKEAEEIRRLVEKSSSTFVVNYQRRFYPLVAGVRDHIKKGKMGRLQQISCFYSNGLYSNGGHLIDSLLYLLGDRIVSARAIVNTGNTTHPKGDLNVDCLLTTAQGITITMQSFDQHVYGASEIRVFGDKETFFIREYGFTVVRVVPKASVFKKVRQLDYKDGRTTTVLQSAVAGALEHVIACHEKKKKPISSAGSAAEVVRVLDLIAKSAKQHKTLCL